MSRAGATTTKSATRRAVIFSPCSHIVWTPPRIVVLDVLPPTEILIRGSMLARRKAIRAATASAIERSREPGLLDPSARPQRAQPAVPPGGRACLLYTSDAADDLLCV